MKGTFKWTPFANINIDDPFFNSLKNDYPEFATKWFPKKIGEKANAFVYSENNNIYGFLYLKDECE